MTIKELRRLISCMPDDMLVGLEANGMSGMEFFPFQVAIPDSDNNTLTLKA